MSKIIIDGRILLQWKKSGIKNYTKEITDHLNTLETFINVIFPNTNNKYLQHVWEHLYLPFAAKNYDLLFCPANIAPVYIPRSTKLVLTLHDIAFVKQKKSFTFFFEKYYNNIIPLNIARASRIITVSQFSKNEIEEHFPKAKGKIEVIYLGVSNKFRQLNTKKKKQILYVGNLNERKNFIGVIKAFELLERSDYKLIIIGEFCNNFNLTAATKEVLYRAMQHPRIEFKHNVSTDELVKLYNESELFLYPSFYEGFGLPVLEAMACGTPVITSNISSLPEVGGDAALYCNPFEINQIKEKIEILLENKDLQKQLIEKGLERVKQFSWKKTAKKHLEIFHKVLLS